MPWSSSHLMRLTRFSDIGLRVLIYLSRTDASRTTVTVAEVASQFDIPQNHLVKVVGHLAKAGWVQALRGRNGGISLVVEPASLRIGVVLRELEGDPELVNCEALSCRLSADCLLRDALRAGMDAFYEAMNRYSLADLVTGNTGEQIIRMHRSFTASSLSAAAAG